MTRIDDETLTVFADGELEAGQMDMVRDALANDPALRERLQQLRALDEILRAAITPTIDMPDRFAKLLQPTAKVVQLQPKKKIATWIPVAGSAIAAGLAVLMFGATLTTPSAGWIRHVDDGVAISGAVEAATIATPSGTLVKTAGLNIRPVVSFLANDGRECREIHVRDKEMAARFIACRDIHHDEWCIEAFATMPLKEFPDSYQTAGVKNDPVIDAALARLGIRQTMDANAETTAIARKWQPRH